LPLLELLDLERTYRVRRGLWGRVEEIAAVNGVSLTLEAGKILGLVGESGCGKSTLGRMALGIETPTAGQAFFDGRPFPSQKSAAWRALRRRMQLVFQDPLGALDRRMTIGSQVEEPLVVHGIGMPRERKARVEELLKATGLRPDQAHSYPHELSGGQRQRAVLARALATGPDLLVCDEPVSALDVSIQAQVVNLLLELQRQFDLAILFISHDLKLVGAISDEVAIMYLGQIVERGAPDAIYRQPHHPYTRALLGAVPNPRRDGPRPLLAGEPPNPAARPSGCAFHLRCPLAMERCRTTAPKLRSISSEHTVACHLERGAMPPTPVPDRNERMATC
jgi:peptide/nickel transport system ATP-binding protein